MKKLILSALGLLVVTLIIWIGLFDGNTTAATCDCYLTSNCFDPIGPIEYCPGLDSGCGFLSGCAGGGGWPTYADCVAANPGFCPY